MSVVWSSKYLESQITKISCSENAWGSKLLNIPSGEIFMF